jgi:excisionase family DNA binding protein
VATVKDEWLSLDDIAEELGIPLRTIYAQRSRGVGPRGYRIGKHVRVRRSDLNAWLDRQADPVSVQ